MLKNSTIYALITIILLATGRADVNDIVVFTDGNALIGLVTAITADSLAWQEAPGEPITKFALRKIYYVYDDFGKILYYSRSLKDRLDYLERYSGYLRTTAGDTMQFQQIAFDRRMVDPLVYLTVNAKAPPLTLPFLEVEQVRMSQERYDVSVRNGCLSGSALILGLAGLRAMGYFFADYPGGGMFSVGSLTTMGNSTWKSITDIMPRAPALGIKNTGSSFRLTTLVIPAATAGWIAWDWYFDKRTIYINPIQTNQPFPHDMFLFSLKEWSGNKINRVWHPVSVTVLNQTYKIRSGWKSVSRAFLEQTYNLRKAIWKG
ncbi:MAG: hypothetical protein ABIA75_14930 [Candidatus Neomarinimicrobiota bacterium]